MHFDSLLHWVLIITKPVRALLQRRSRSVEVLPRPASASRSTVEKSQESWVLSIEHRRSKRRF